MPEIWDVYDENRVKKPYTHVRGVPLDAGDWHLVVETWVVTQDNRVLLISRQSLDFRPMDSFDLEKYHEDTHNYNIVYNRDWARCEMRQWLNGEFLTEAFSRSEQRLLAKTIIRGGLVLILCGIAVFFVPNRVAVLPGLLLFGTGCGPIFPSILHCVPQRFGAQYSADITGFHMGGAYAIGFAVQMSFGFTAAATTFKILPFVLLGLCILCISMNETAIGIIGRAKSRKVQ